MGKCGDLPINSKKLFAPACKTLNDAHEEFSGVFHLYLACEIAHQISLFLCTSATVLQAGANSFLELIDKSLNFPMIFFSDNAL